MSFRRARLPESEEYQQAEDQCRKTVSNEEGDVTVFSQQTCKCRRDRISQVDRPVNVPIGTRPVFGWDEIRDRGADRWSVQIGEHSEDEGTQGDQTQVFRQPE